MNIIESEKEFQKFILNFLKDKNGYVIRKNEHFDRLCCMDRGLFFKFLKETQPKELKELKKIFRDSFEDTLINYISNEISKPKCSLLDVLKDGVTLSNIHLDLMYTKPATGFNPEQTAKYSKNIFSAAEEVWASDKERADIVIFLNGFAIMSLELKSNFAGQSCQDAIYQYREERNPKTRLFMFKYGCLVHFAMDLEQVFMATKLCGEPTVFLPFNKGNGEGLNAGKGNPPETGSSYMWEDILKKDSVIELISKFILHEIKEEEDKITGKKQIKESIIFPRFHQRDAIHKILADVYENGSSQNYLIQHSAGSGKSYSIAWLAYRLSELHNAEDKIIFDNIVIVTDRIVVDRQLQSTILGIKHKSGFIKAMDDKCTSADLAEALAGNTKIIVTTIQKFPYIVSEVKNLKKKKFAIIIDEAHSSTAGKDMEALTQALTAPDIQEEERPAEDIIKEELARYGKQPNISVFAFTATPKNTTLELFGRLNSKGHKEAFHIYSMKQAIEEGFILDVLQNYITYKTLYQLNKEIQEDPKYKTSEAKKQISRFIDLHEVNISQRVQIIAEHFKNVVIGELGGRAKAMVITPSRESAVKYRQKFEEYIRQKNYTDIKALVAFSGKVKSDGAEYTESGMNGIPENSLREAFDTDAYNVLLVANKYQTGFDQPKLCAMYVMKSLSGVNAVQTLSRLNRIYPPYQKKTFVLDFVNSYEDMEAAFSKYYTATFLSNTVTPKLIYDIEAKIDGFTIISPNHIEELNEAIYKGSINAKDKRQLKYIFSKTKKEIEDLEEAKQAEFIEHLRNFVRFYDFLLQASCLEDIALHKKYNFITFLLSYISIRHGGSGFDINGKIKAINFVQKKTREPKKPEIISNPVIKLPNAETAHIMPDNVKRLSEIIQEINSMVGKNYDSDVAVKAILQIKDILLKSEKLKKAANNTFSDFTLAYNTNVDEALIEGLDQNNDLFTLLLNNSEIKKNVLGIFAEEVYKALREQMRK
jgi:type I restriction enzyme R subunit